MFKLPKKNTIVGLYVLLAVGLGIGLFISRIDTPSILGWMSESWTYRKPIVVSNGGSTVTNADVLIQVDTAALIAAGKMRGDCNDIRFTDSDETTSLTYWIEGGCNTATTQVWTRIPSVPNGGKTIYMYYGNSTTTNGELNSGTIFHLLATSAACPTGWTRNAGYDNKLAYGSTTYGTTGGTNSHTHTISGTTNLVAGASELYGSTSSLQVSGAHSHTYSFNSANANSSPPYLKMLFCYKNKLDISAGLISIFAANPGTEWTRFSALDNKFAMGSSAYGDTGGAESQTETFSGSTSAPTGSGLTYKDYNTNNFSSSTVHTHTVSGTLASSSILPPYVNVLYYSRNTAGVAAPNQITMVNTLPPLGWTRLTTLDGKYPRGASTYGGTGGATTHTHTYSATTANSASRGVYSLATDTITVYPHSHTISGTSGPANNLPYYLLTIFAKRNISLATTLETEETLPPSPPVPTTLYTEGATTPINVTDRSPEFSAIFTDIYTSQTGTYYQIQVNTSSDFTGTTMWDSTKQAMAVANGARSADITYAGETLEGNTTYYWRIKFWDNLNTEGDWVSSQFSMSGDVLTFSDTSASSITSNSATISSNISFMPALGATDTGFWFSAYSSLKTPPVSAYFFNETDPSQIIDSVGGVNGTNTNSTVTTGIIGNAHSFNGTTDYITLPNSDNFNFGDGDFTISTWVYFRDLTKGTQFIAENRDGTNGWYLYFLSSNILKFNFYSAAGAHGDVLNAAVGPTVNEWSHIVVTRRGTNFEMYLNNTLIKAGTFDGTIGANTTNAIIGMSATPGLYGLDGLIDNFVIYKKGFTSTDIANLYNNGASTEEYSKKISTGASSTTGPISTALSSLTPLTDYYFKPYAVTDGDTVFGTSSTFTTLADNFTPTASKDNISGGTDIYAGKSIDIQAKYSDQDGSSNLDKAFIQIKNPSGTNIEYYATITGSNQTGQTATSVSGSEYISSITYDTTINSPTSNDVTVTWHITPNWNWTRDTTIQYGVKAADKILAESAYDYTVATYKYENRLTYTGTLTATDYNGDSLSSGDWTRPNSTVNFTGIKVVYAGTTNVYPNDIDFDARVTNSQASFWDDYTSVGRDISINATTVDATNTSDTYTFSIPEIPTGGEDISNVTFIIKTDKTNPVISSLTSSTHPDSNTWYTATSATFNWSITDADSGLQGVWYLLNNSETTADADVITNGVLTSENQVTLNGLTTNTWYLHLVARDNFDNTSSSTYTLKVDTSTPDIIAVTGDNNDTWQNSDAGPIISWTDPNSPSDDTFYITNDGSEPTSANNTYTTTSNTYDLPNQAEGTTTIKVRAMNGVGTYSVTRSFVVKFDSTNPVIASLTSSTHPNPSLWYNSSTATFNWAITENGSGIQNTWYVLNTNETMEDADVITAGTTTSNTTATINDLTTNTWYFHLVVRDNCNNTISSAYTLKVDISMPDIVAITGNNNDTWQNADSGPIISWTDPNSLSDDTFYITNDDSEPTSTNYTYTTTSNTYDLPNQSEGITTIKVRAQNGIGTYGITRSFIIKYEATNPVISSLTSSTHPNSSLWYNASTATFDWVSNDADSGVQNTWYVINTSAITSDADVISGGTATSETTATINDLTTNTWYFHLVVRDNANNTIASTYSLKIDISIPDIVAITGDNNDTWQNVNSGPVISWTDPNSLSNDTFYITNNGSEPTSTNYAYTTTNSSYDLPNQAEGTTTIKVRALNGIGTYSVTRSFIIKYDTTNPVIASITSSTHPDSNAWYHSPTATFNWTITEEGSGVQNSWYLLDTNPSTTNEDVISGGTATAETTATINDLTSNIQYFHLVIRDNCGNTVASSYMIKTDLEIPDIVAVTGDYNDTWQNVNSGPIISWTDPNSLSDDTFYITNDGTFPTSTNYRYTMTDNSFDLPDQNEGEITIKVRAMSGSGVYSETRTFIIKYDNTNPAISSLTSSTHSDSNAWYSTSTATFNWSLSDEGSGIKSTWYLLDNNANTNNAEIISNGTLIVESTVTINDITSNIWYFHLVTSDNCDQITSSTYSFKIDTSTPDIINITGLYNNEWQDIDAGPVISWTDPSSLSNDTFYITNNGSEPTSTNYTYTTTSDTFNLPDQEEGEITIKARAINGANTSSEIRTFIVKYSSANPEIPTLISSTHPNQSMWYSSSNLSINWIVTDNRSGIDKVWSLFDQVETQTNSTIATTGTETTSTGTYNTTITSNGTWYFHLLTKNNQGFEFSKTFKVNLDNTIPAIGTVTGNNNNVWQNTDAGPVISWTDPKSLSDDTFYITNNGTEPTKTNFTYSTSSSTYDLPNQKQGETTIRVRAMNGAGTYSTTSNFIVKYDGLAPANVSELKATSTANSITLTWIDPTIFDFTNVVIVKNTSRTPLSITDGTIVYEEEDSTFTDTKLTAATDYYYTVFSLDTVGNRSSGAIIQAKTLSSTPDVPAVPETPKAPTTSNTPAAPINIVIPPIDDNTQIIKVQDLSEEKKVNITVDEKTITTTSIGNLHVYPKQTLQIEIPIEAIGHDIAEIKQVILTINNQAFNLEYNSVTEKYQTTINAPAIKGAYDASIITISNTDKNVFTVTASLLVDPYGYVFSNFGEDEIRISNAKVSLYTKKDGAETLYQSSGGINNPQYTNAQGEYQYFVEPGEYKLVVEAQGYIPFETEWFTVEKSIIEMNIRMQRNPYLWYGIIAIVEIAIGFSLIVIRKKKRKSHV